MSEGFLIRDGKFYFLNDIPGKNAKGVFIRDALCINQRGEILAYRETGEKKYTSGFLLKPAR
jgi:hypothetical protein